MIRNEIIKSPIVEKIEDALDINFNVSIIKIDSFEEFEEELYKPFTEGDKVFYRGERISSYERRLIPTLLRKESSDLKKLQVEKFVNINSQTLYNTYTSKKQFLDIYKLLYGEPDIHSMYNMTAFAQHYLDLSPLIDFTKSLYVAASFAIKGREEVNDDFVIYTVRDISGNNTTKETEQVNEWLESYNVSIINLVPANEIRKRIAQRKQLELKQPKEIIEDIKNRDIIKEFKRFEGIAPYLSPSAKLIDIPTNDLMKFQQGVFLLLDGFNLIDSKYLTKEIRQEFEIKKYIIDKDLAYDVSKMIYTDAPEYRFECLLNISKAVNDYNG